MGISALIRMFARILGERTPRPANQRFDGSNTWNTGKGNDRASTANYRIIGIKHGEKRGYHPVF